MLHAQQYARYKAVTKEAAAAISNAFEAYKQSNPVTATTKFADITPYLNYIKASTSSSHYLINCDNTSNCLYLHSGAMILYDKDNRFGGTSATNALMVYVYPNPDDRSQELVMEGGQIDLFVYANGRLTSNSGVIPNTSTANSSSTITGITPYDDPVWFSWN